MRPELCGPKAGGGGVVIPLTSNNSVSSPGFERNGASIAIPDVRFVVNTHDPTQRMGPWGPDGSLVGVQSSFGFACARCTSCGQSPDY